MILDTNALSAYLDGPPEVADLITDARVPATPVIVAGKFTFGIAQSRYRDAYERSLQRMRNHPSLRCNSAGTQAHG